MNLFRALLFTYVTPLVKLSRHHLLQAEDMPLLPVHLKASESSQAHMLQMEKKNFWFLLHLLRVYKKQTTKAYLAFTVALVAMLFSPTLLNLFIKALESKDWQGSLILGSLIGLSGLLAGIGFQQYFFYCLQANQKVTNDLNQKIFKKSLSLSLKAKSKVEVGDVVNHMSSDCDSISDFPILLGDLVWAIVTLIVTSGLLFYYIGLSAIGPLILLLLLAPMTKMIAAKFVSYEETMMSERDARITLMGQILNSIRLVKSFSWEKAVSIEVGAVRKRELDGRRGLARAEILSGIFYLAIGTLVLFVALGTHVYRGFALDAALIFTCVSIFQLMEEPFGSLSRLFSRLTQAIVSANRIQKFLKNEDIPEANYQAPKDSNHIFELDQAVVGYQEGEAKNVLIKKFSLNVRQGQSLAIVGGVGSGKTSFLHTLLGEIPILEGALRRHKDFFSMGYVPQEAYIINSTLLENIQFGQETFSKEKLRKAIHAACLDKDIQDLPSGLRTEIGEKGVNLSGGQKQRVSLARAALVDPLVILLDDPLSAVDPETEEKICDRLIFGLWKEKTRIIATHRLEFLKRFDQVVFLRNNQIEAIGSFDELMRTSKSFQDFHSHHSHVVEEKEIPTNEVQAHTELENLTDTRITEDEEREKGAVKASVYWDYLKSLGGYGKYSSWVIAALGFSAILAAAAPLIQKGWLAKAADDPMAFEPTTVVLVFGALSIFVLVSYLISQWMWVHQGIKSGRMMHDRMLNSILKSQVRFFDSTPVGRILQRFSRDLESVDVYLQWTFEAFVRSILHVMVSLLLVVAVLPLMLLLLAPAFYYYYGLQRDYRRPAREAKRIDSIARSPRYAHFKETLTGLTVIRSFHKQDWFLQQFFSRLEFSQRMFYGHYLLNRWFSSRVPVLGGVVSLGVMYCLVLASTQGWMTAGLAGLVTVYSMNFWAQLNWGIRIFADIESRMTSVERLKFYSNLPAEGVKSQGMLPPKDNWPTTGELRFQNVKARYASHLPLVLKDIHFHIPAGQKVGIVGRTGSGKSTLFQTLYRFVEIEEGSIEIDGVNIANVDLHQFRKSLVIVPQDPTLFLGTLRSNLDRYHQYQDAEIWSSLEKAGLKKFVEGLPKGLLTGVSENGANLSQGQRQLICLARALLVKAKLVLMDEATASVDVETDHWIQKVIKESLAGVTLILIAHRLGTVMDCDQIIELSNGEVVRIFDPRREKIAAEALLS